MAENEFRVPVSEDEWFHFRIVTERGVVQEFCVAYVILVEGKAYQPCRIDNAHGDVHLDILDAAGNTIWKEPLGHVEANDMVSFARARLRERIEQERDRILEELWENFDVLDE